jgi:hypothetical protein
MKKYKVILTESEMQKLRHLVNEKVNDDDVDVNVGGTRLHKNLKRGDNYLKKMIIDLLKSETDFNVRMDMAGDIVVESYAMLMCYIEIDSDGGLIDLTFATEEDLDMQYNIDDYNDSGRNGLETLAKNIVSYLEEVM